MTSNSEKEQGQQQPNTHIQQQVLDLTQEVKDLKVQLMQREARLMATIQVVNTILQKSEAQVNKHHKILQQNIAGLTNWMGESLAMLIESQLEEALKGLTYANEKKLSDQFRGAEKIGPLIEIDDATINPMQGLPGTNPIQKSSK